MSFAKLPSNKFSYQSKNFADKILSLVILYMIIFAAKLLTVCGFEQLNEFQQVVVKGRYNLNHEIEVDQNKVVIMRFDDSRSKYPYTVFAWSNQTFFDHPIFLVVKQQKGVTSWQLPLPVETKGGTLNLQNTSRTMCHNNMKMIAEAPRSDVEVYQLMLHKELSILISTASRIPTPVIVRVEEPTDFYVEEDQDYTVTISPSEPRYYYYKFYEEGHPKYATAVVLEVSSEDDNCLTVSIQNATCPVADLNQDIAFEGKYQTVNLKGGIIIKRNEYPNGFFVVLVVQGDNYACSRESSIIPQPKPELLHIFNRFTTVTFNITRSISQDDYLVASLSTLGVILIFYLVFSMSTWGFYHWSKLRKTEKKVSTEDISLGNSLYCIPIDTLDNNSRDGSDDVDARLVSTHLMLSDLADSMTNKIKLKSLVLDGNQFNEAGKTAMKEKLKQIGKFTALGGLDECDSEDDEGSEQSCEDSEESDSEEEVDMTAVESALDFNNTLNIAEDRQDLSVKGYGTFLRAPTAENFLSLGNNRDDLILGEIKKLPDSYLDNLIPLVMKISALSTNNQEQVARSAVNCSDLLYKELFSWALKNDKLSLVNNSMLVHLGLIKSEDKKFKATWNVDGCLHALEAVMNQSYIPDTTKDTLRVFMGREIERNGDLLDVKRKLLIVLA